MITDYDSLRAAIGNWLARADLASAIPEFIQLAEARINRSLFVRERMAEVSGTTESGVITLPSDLDRIISLRVACGGAKRPIHPITVDRNPDHVGVAVGYSVIGNFIHVAGSDATDYTLTYYARIPALGTTNTQNWLILKDPSLYLYGALIEASPYLKNDDRTVIWAQQFKAVLDDMQMSDERARYGNAPAPSVGFNAP